MLTADIFEIKRFAVHDGDGIRTTVFFKGCPLKCLWCHNPEGLSKATQLAYYKNKCSSCGICVTVCPNSARKLLDGIIYYNSKNCNFCGKCVDSCPNNALNIFGKKVTTDELLSIILEDKDFYDNSNGGVTLSGGECLIQADFCAELLKKAKEHKIHTAIDTCGYVLKTEIEKVIPYTDVFLYDIKAFDSKLHKKLTGVKNELIFDNLFFIDSKGKDIEIRIPLIPDLNDNELDKVASKIKDLKHLKKVKILPYHRYASSKYLALNVENTLPEKVPTEQDLANAINVFKNHGILTE